MVLKNLKKFLEGEAISHGKCRHAESIGEMSRRDLSKE